ncbi:MAG TPA: glycosyl hydrolase family 28-related protein [Mucilaginibacter sp.]|jgi:hypothetical protein|nr:glycosyl hydrolase family 28-related protein [Mucilaginibacter sp.]
MRRSIIGIIFFLQALACCAQDNLNQAKPFILNYSETVNPGEILALQGSAFGTEPKVWLTVLNSAGKKQVAQVELAPLTKSDVYIGTRIPPGIAAGLYAIRVENNKQLSEPVFINRARVMLSEFDEIMPGTTFRLFGRNLGMAGFESEVKFVDPAGGHSLKAKIVKADAYQLMLKAPDSLTPGITYKVYVSNGAGGAYGDAMFEEIIKIRKQGTDALITGVPWGADFSFTNNVFNVKTDNRLTQKAKGDGVNNDRAAIQQAIDLASRDGGGVVYLPAGNYKLAFASGSGITMKSHVVLKGDGMDKTTIKYGYGEPFSTERAKASYGWTLGWPDSRSEGVGMVWPGNITTSGLFNLSLQNVNESGAFVHNIKDMPEGGSKIILQNCSFDLNTGWGLAMANIDHLLVSGCIFKSTTVDVRGINAPMRSWPWDFKNSWNMIVRNNKQYYNAGRFGANGCHHALLEHNDFIRNGNVQAKGETGGLSLDYVLKLVVMSNTFTVSGNSIPNRNQGETILTQGSNPNQQTVGTVTLATLTTIMDRKQEYQDFTDRASTDWELAYHPTNYSIAIVSGTGTGQWRYIIHNNDTSLTVDKPWDVVPMPGSKYVIMQWSANQMMVIDNLLKDNAKGIYAYSGCHDLVIVGNKLINSEGIYLRSDQRLLNNRFNLTWGAQVFDNQVINTEGKRPAYIAVFLAQVKSDKLFGTGTLGVEVRRNTVQAYLPNLKKGTVANGEGYFNYVYDENYRGSTREYTTAGILGTVFENNKAINTDHAYKISSGVHHTIIVNGENEKVLYFLDDVVNQQIKKGAAFTYVDSTLAKPVILTPKLKLK